MVVEKVVLLLLEVDVQMSMLHKKQSMSELDVRLRYFLASLVEDVVHRIFPDAVVRLFGSAVTGLGRYDCDLDMVLDLEPEQASGNVSSCQTSFFCCRSISTF